MILEFIELLYTRFLDLLLAPINYTETLWMVIPVLATLFLVELYFGRYKAEELGWNSAFANSLVLIFVSIDMIRYLYYRSGISIFYYVTPEIALVIAVVIEGVALTLMSFYHVLPKDIAFNMSSALPMNMIAYISLLLVYTGIPIDLYTLLAAFGVMAVFVCVIKIIHMIEPKVY